MKSKSSFVWVLMCTAALGVGAVAEYVVHTPKLKQEQPIDVPAPTPTAPKARTEAEQPPKQDVASVLVYTPEMDTTGITFTKASVSVPSGTDAKVAAINEFLKAAQLAPDDALALSVDVRDDGTAEVVFTKSFEQSYGAFDEKKMIDGLRAALGQFPDVSAFTMLIGDKALTTLGSADLSSPIPVLRADSIPLRKVSKSPGVPTQP